MTALEIVAVGRMKPGALAALYDEYAVRLRGEWKLTLHEIDERKPAEPAILARIADADYVFILDERGKTLPSEAFARQMATIVAQGRDRIAFVIGGADGHSDQMRARADMLLSFGAQTWPHMLARVMLAEQIYRAQTILSGHPYHRA